MGATCCSDLERCPPAEDRPSSPLPPPGSSLSASPPKQAPDNVLSGLGGSSGCIERCAGSAGRSGDPDAASASPTSALLVRRSNSAAPDTSPPSSVPVRPALKPEALAVGDETKTRLQCVRAPSLNQSSGSIFIPPRSITLDAAELADDGDVEPGAPRCNPKSSPWD
mmetsp:Transcript_130081/g.277882  ORF Transcript_130081/g.277882 Transcript_130081/m.277882 type:complete len:167 (-) Transcript_130081:74-574(-)|eukprot:CAMPEP_0180624526 /NCGR_PEP_ID=MMETSP1037_2-20121125/36826_1 /TAXON_ID=632150 /ORGANISM="Azadinium spinosum, Strain 3D9" /LENGTH=166 /DNA_ID=CAMNT_0022644969 /DNA_START=131 /DNA_END=631 /DNA_ORIENTATION=-